ncbi:MAG: succinate dehydrogenase, hydrophobic membrane anchor protein [Pseudomonadota bacterium]
MVERIVTGAHYGLRDWLVQRVTAVMMGIYALVFAAYVLWHPRLEYDIWTELFSHQVMRSFTLLFLFAVYYHAWIGVRNVVMDYVKAAPVRLIIYILVVLALLMYAVWSVQILWGM